MRPGRAFALLVVLVALAAPASAVAAGCPRTTVASLESEVMCQVCGVPLSLATDAPEARRERAFIAKLAARCESKGEIKAALVAQLGPSVLADPPRRGFNAAAYLVPALGLGCAAALVAGLGLAWRRRRRHEQGDAAAPPALSAADRARVDAALERWSRG